MTKASGPKARPKVAKKGTQKVSDLYDFVQSPEWQEVLENARIQQDMAQAAQGQTAGQGGQPNAGQSEVKTSTSGSAAPKAAPAGAGQPKAVQNKPKPTSGGQPSESATISPKRAESSQNVKTEGGIQGNAAAPPDAQNQNKEPKQEAVQDDAHPVGAGSEYSETAALAAEPSLRLSEGEVADRLRKTLLERMEDQKRNRRKLKFGFVAIGCVIGVAASSSVFIAMSDRGTSVPVESAGFASEETELASRELFADTETIAPDTTAEQAGLSASVFDAPTGSLPSDDAITETEDVAGLTDPLSNPESSGEVEPKLLRLAPSVRPFVPSLTQPPLPLTLLSYRPREEMNLGFVRFQSTPEIFSTSVALLEETVTGTRPEDFLAGATITAVRAPIAVVPPETPVARQSAPTVPVQPEALVFVPPQVPVGQATLSEQALVYQPQDRGLDAGAPRVDLIEPEALASLDIELPPVAPPPAVPDRGDLQVESIDPTLQPEGTAIAPQSTDPAPSEQIETAALSAEPETLPTESPAPSAAPIPPTAIDRTAVLEVEVTPEETPPPAAQVAFRLYAPNNLPQGVVDSVVSDLTTTGHELSGQARVGFGISQSNVRFYHRQDEARAAALAEDAGALLRDFTDAGTKTPSGIIELWLAGEGSGVAAVKRTTRQTRAQAPAPNRVNRLRSQVLSKLKKATTQ
ncbi:hypothetical protein [Ruegeria sp. R14_0]|uniref:hypothetical protein n=1 Tax=Ruegeria sp. R14_0 TaxID=2821100 RepID=UPI001ADBE56D|nr:hypothetical protein [Ruegeria sp. R14_0]MBO9446323.1 hypothetical protein [Ruegeria sp. R14_0]